MFDKHQLNFVGGGRLPKLLLSGLLWFLGALAFVLLSNLLLIGEVRYAMGHTGRTLMTSMVLGAFLFIFRRDRRSLLAGISLYLSLLIPVVLLGSTAAAEEGEVSKVLARAIASSNHWALCISILVMVVTTSSCFFANGAVRNIIRTISVVMWLLGIGLPLLFLGYWVTHRAVLSPDILLAVYQTNPDEAWEYVSFLGWNGFWVVLASTFLLLAVAVRTFTCRQTLFRADKVAAVMATVTLVASGFVAVKAQSNLVSNVFRDAVRKVVQIDAYKEGVKDREALIASLRGLSEQGHAGLYVVVVGESQTRDRMSAYGYERNTTPWLQARRKDEGFVFFDASYSCYVLTVQALSQALTAQNQYSSRTLAESPSVVEMMGAAGFDVWWLSNQVQLSAWDTPTTIIADQADRKVWLQGTELTTIRKDVYDDALIDELKRIPVEPATKRVVFLHVYGCHYDYDERYPARAAKWSSDKVGDTYDNAVLFNDAFSRKLYEALRERTDFQALVYVSDHGEDVDIGHKPDRFTWPMARIPFWAAFSDRFKTEHPGTVEAMRANAGKPWTNDMFFDTLCGILGVTEHPYYEPKNDISSDTYARTPEELTTLFGKKRIAEDPNLRR